MEPCPLLLVDPSEATREPLAAALVAEGWPVTHASSVDQAFALAKTSQPRVLVANRLDRPGDALVLMKKLRGSARTALTPVVAVVSDDETKRALVVWGVEVTVDAPATSDAVLAAVRRVAAPPAPTLAPAPLLETPNRLNALARTALLDSPPETLFDRVAQTTARFLDVPVVLMSLVDRNRQFFKTHVGLPEPLAAVRQTPLTHSFCQWVVSSDDELVVSDVQRHPVLSHNAATRDLAVGAYAGVPLHGDTHEAIGSFCAIDMKPHSWDQRDLRALRDAARVIDALTALRQASHLAPATMHEWQALSGVVGDAVQAVVRLHVAGRHKMTEDQEHEWLSLTADLGKQLSARAAVRPAEGDAGAAT